MHKLCPPLHFNLHLLEGGERTAAFLVQLLLGTQIGGVQPEGLHCKKSLPILKHEFWSPHASMATVIGVWNGAQEKLPC